MKFESPTEKAETPTETQAKTSRIKSAFFALTGLIGKKKRDK
jgi:hypothetical protein